MAGRPTKYDEAILATAQTYLNGGYLEREVIPTVAGLARAMGITRTTVYDWASQEEKQEFSDIVEDLLADQELSLVSGGLRGDYNATMAKLALSKHGYMDKVENTHQGPGGGPVSVESNFNILPVRGNGS